MPHGKARAIMNGLVAAAMVAVAVLAGYEYVSAQAVPVRIVDARCYTVENDVARWRGGCRGPLAYGLFLECANMTTNKGVESVQITLGEPSATARVGDEGLEDGSTTLREIFPDEIPPLQTGAVCMLQLPADTNPTDAKLSVAEATFTDSTYWERKAGPRDALRCYLSLDVEYPGGPDAVAALPLEIRDVSAALNSRSTISRDETTQTAYPTLTLTCHNAWDHPIVATSFRLSCWTDSGECARFPHGKRELVFSTSQVVEPGQQLEIPYVGLRSLVTDSSTGDWLPWYDQLDYLRVEVSKVVDDKGYVHTYESGREFTDVRKPFEDDVAAGAE